MARRRCGYFGFILGFLIVKCMAQDALTPRILESENSTDNFHDKPTEYLNTSTQLGNNVTARTDYSAGTQTSVTSIINFTDNSTSVSKNDSDFSPFISVTKKENATNWSIGYYSTSSANFDEERSTVELNTNKDRINGSFTDIPELVDLLNTSTLTLPTVASGNFYTVNDSNENISLTNRTILSTDITNAETETTESRSFVPSSGSTGNAFSSVPSTIVSPSENPPLNDTVSDVFSSTMEPDLAETGANSTYSKGNLVTSNIGSVGFETTKLSPPYLNETETTLSFEEATTRESSTASRLDKTKTQSYGFTSEPRVDFENTTDQITHSETETAETPKSTISVDGSSNDASDGSVNGMFHPSTTFGENDNVINSTVSPSSIIISTTDITTSQLDVSASDNRSKSTADDNESTTERSPFVTSPININDTSSPDDTIVTSTENDIGKTSSIFDEDNITEKSHGSTIFDLTSSPTSTFTASASDISTKYNYSDIVPTTSTLSSHNESIIEMTITTDKSIVKEDSSTIVTSEASSSSSSIQEFIPTTIRSLTTLERDDSSRSSGITLTSTIDNASVPSSHDDVSSSFTTTTRRFSTEVKASSIQSSPGLSTSDTEHTISDRITTSGDNRSINESSTPPSFRTTDVVDSTSSPSSLNDTLSESVSTAGFSTEEKPSSEHSSTTEIVTTFVPWKINVSSTSSPFATTESYSTSTSDSTSTSSSYDGFASTTTKFSTEEKLSSIESSSSISSLRTESTIPSTFPTAWTSFKTTGSSTSSSFEITQSSERSSTPTSTAATSTDEIKKVNKCTADEAEMEPGNAVTVLFSLSSIDMQQDDDGYEIRFQQSALACLDAQHLFRDNKKNENTHTSISSEDDHRNFESNGIIVCASPVFSPEGQTFSITFYVRDFKNGSEKAISADIVTQLLKSCKSKIEEEVGLNITGIFEKLQVSTMPPEEDAKKESVLQRHASLFIALSLVFGLLLIFGTVVFVYFYCCNRSRHYDAEKKKLKQDMSTSVEIGDMISANEILNGEIGEKEVLGLSNGSSAHLVRMEDDGWVVPYLELPVEDKNPPDVQDTKL